MGSLKGPLQTLKLSRVGARGLARAAWLVSKSWDEIDRVVEELPIPERARVYQDGLPVCGNERRVVAELAEAGSRNHRLLLRLVDRGAILMGTESSELLLQEYQLAVNALTARGPRKALRSAGRERDLGESLLERRDKFIGARISGTLNKGETGILFLGALHSVEQYLENDITVVYPLSVPQRATSDKATQ